MEFENSEILDFINTEVPTYQRGLLVKSFQSDSLSIDFYEQIGKELTGEIRGNNLLLNTGPSINKTSFLEKVKEEVYLYICTEDEKYGAERNLIGKNFKDVVTILSTAIAATFSIGTGVIVGIITNILISIIMINKNAWCELQKEKIDPSATETK